LFNSHDLDKQALEMRKVLILAGMDISVDLLDPDIMKDV
jgi:hypothetical protein